MARFVQTLDSAIQRISIRENEYIIHWIEVYPMNSVILFLKNWGLTGLNTTTTVVNGYPSFIFPPLASVYMYVPLFFAPAR